MNLKVQYVLKNNPLYIKYLRENSNWYKILNRYPDKIDEFIENVKIEYKLRPVDKFNKITEYLDLFQAIVSNLK